MEYDAFAVNVTDSYVDGSISIWTQRGILAPCKHTQELRSLLLLYFVADAFALTEKYWRVG